MEADSILEFVYKFWRQRTNYWAPCDLALKPLGDDISVYASDSSFAFDQQTINGLLENSDKILVDYFDTTSLLDDK